MDKSFKVKIHTTRATYNKSYIDEFDMIIDLKKEYIQIDDVYGKDYILVPKKEICSIDVRIIKE